MGTDDDPEDVDTDIGRRQALLDSLDGLVGCTRVREIRYRIEMAESRVADLRAIDWPLRGRRHQGRILYGDDIREMERQIADLNGILDAAQARDEWDRYTHLAVCLLNQALDELTLAVQAGSLTPEAAVELDRQTDRQTGHTGYRAGDLAVPPARERRVHLAADLRALRIQPRHHG